MRIKLGLDCPTSWLEQVQPLADYDYVLVDKALKDERYLNYFEKSNRPKILNNRLMFTGEPISLDKIKIVWDVLGGEVLAPDWMGDPWKTHSIYEECRELFGEVNVIGVMQGTTRDNIYSCHVIYGNKVALPFDVGSKKEDSVSVKVCRRILSVFALSAKKVHLLGLTTPRELEAYKDVDNVESLNTGLPILLAMQGKSLRNFNENKKDSSYHSMDMDIPLDEKTFKLVEENIKELRNLL